MQKCFLGRTGRFLAADKRGEHSMGGKDDVGGSWLLEFGLKQLVKVWKLVNNFKFLKSDTSRAGSLCLWPRTTGHLSRGMEKALEPHC